MSRKLLVLRRSEGTGLVVLQKGSRGIPKKEPPVGQGPETARTAPKRSGKMRVVLNVHGGLQGLADVMEGLVVRNLRAIKEGTAPKFTDTIQPFDETAAAWKDAPMAMQDGYVSGRTASAWYAATLRSEGIPARIGFRDNRPAVYGQESDGSVRLIRVFGGPEIEGLEPTEGRSDERMVVTIDDNEATPVMEINNAIARHNARRIKLKNLPPLYRSGVKYKPEGSPELWWDAEEILRNGHDDCEGLAAYRAGELINRGYDARVYCRLVQTPSKEMGGSGKPGGRLFHAVTMIYGPDGKALRTKEGHRMIDDPSMRLSMKVPSWYAEFARKIRQEGKDL